MKALILNGCCQKRNDVQVLLTGQHLRGGQYWHDGRHVPHCGNSPSAYELRRERNDYDHGVIGAALECQAPPIEFFLVKGRLPCLE